MTCNAVRQQDEMFCAKCGLRWDANELFPRDCQRNTDRLVIGIAGRAGSGKSTMAKLIRICLGHSTVVKFADPLKAATRGLLIKVGFTDAEAERAIEGDLKNVPDPRLGGYSPRQFMQAIGNGVRTELDHAFWVSLWSARVGSTHIVADDVRYQNEADAVRALGGKVVMITGRADDTVPMHASEEYAFDPDMTFHNTGTIWDMERWVLTHVVR